MGLASTCQLKTIQSRVWNSRTLRFPTWNSFCRMFWTIEGQLKEVLGIMTYWLQVHICNNAFNSPSVANYKFLIQAFTRNSLFLIGHQTVFPCFFFRDSLLQPPSPPVGKCPSSSVFHFSILFLEMSADEKVKLEF